MQISLNWLNEFLDLRGYTLNYLVKRLTIEGFEVERCIQVKCDNVTSIALQISTTTNRGDVNSIRGIAREVKTILSRTRQVPQTAHPGLIRRIKRKYKVKLVKKKRFITFDELQDYTFNQFKFKKAGKRKIIAFSTEGYGVSMYNRGKLVPIYHFHKWIYPRKQSAPIYAPNWKAIDMYAELGMYNPYKPPRTYKHIYTDLRYNHVRQTLEILTIQRRTFYLYEWRLENIVFRSHKWKYNRTYHPETVFNKNDPKLFSKFFCWSIRDLKNVQSPKWLQKKLLYSGITPENNLSDFQNYIRLEFGYHYEFYDFDKIQSKCESEDFELSLSPGTNLEFIAENNLKYKLNENIAVFKANESILSVAGLISNKEFVCTKLTKSLFIEMAMYKPRMILRQSRLLNLKTMRSNYQVKGGIGSDYFLDGIYRFLLLLKLANPDLECRVHTGAYGSAKESRIYHVKFVTSYHWPEVEVLKVYDFWLRETKISQIMGEGYYFNPIQRRNSTLTKKLTAAYIEYLLRRSEISHKFRRIPGLFEEWFLMLYGRMPFPPVRRYPHLMVMRGNVVEGRYWILIIPSHRREDLTREIDVVGEICRLYGVDRIQSTSLKIHDDNLGTKDLSSKIRKEMINTLLNEGFNEVISYSLVNTNMCNNKPVKIINPLAIEYSILRTSLLPGLIEIASENIKQGNKTFEGFEFGHIFSMDSAGNYFETECISGIFGGLMLKSNWSDKLENLSWFEAKGKIEQIFERFNLATIWKNCNTEFNSKAFHPYRTAIIYLTNGRKLGNFGELNPLLAKSLNISSKFYLFEFDFPTLTKRLKKEKLKQKHNLIYTPYSLYPKIVKDLSFVVDKSISFNQIKNLIYFEAGDFLSEVNLLDQYQNDFNASAQISLCIQLIFQSFDRTLKNEEIDDILNRIVLILKRKYKVDLRL